MITRNSERETDLENWKTDTVELNGGRQHLVRVQFKKFGKLLLRYTDISN